ncbi:OpgC domain-containing protein [Aquabacterium sp. A7-Y]|uniref:OpgC domain-containing protein n=1 Tax=Aquabacterium sp. A7-Y TaxID=1349605 RepID=UPI00223C9FF2|nr:OpgC domain-containing protein [Aquabacterium sp. A7-Y]MCW7536587.1 OpgC domain-containing protein [Aquabacterium sp. A7-Y]
MSRRWELDALRGLMLVLMTLTHLPTRLSYPLGHTFGFVSAAEGFVLLSGFMAGLVYTRRARCSGLQAMQEGLRHRALTVYLCQLGLLLLLFFGFAELAQRRGQPELTHLTGYFLEQPRAALAAALALLYQPALLDVLPMYVLFLLASAWLLAHGLRYGWHAILAGSVLLWLLSQFDLTAALHGLAVRHAGWPVRLEDSGSFVLPAWQFLWVLGLWMGSTRADGPLLPAGFPRWMLRTALTIAGLCLVWRHLVGQQAFGADATLNLLFDKWRLGPLRLINLFALLVVVMHYGPLWASSLPRPRYLESLGQASLSVFNAHLVFVLAVLALFGGNPAQRPALLDAALLAVVFCLLWVVARVMPVLGRWRPARPQAAAGPAAHRRDQCRCAPMTVFQRL